MMKQRKQKARGMKRTGLAILILFAVLCTAVPIQTQAASSAQGDRSQQKVLSAADDIHGQESPSASSDSQTASRGNTGSDTDQSIQEEGAASESHPPLSGENSASDDGQMPTGESPSSEPGQSSTGEDPSSEPGQSSIGEDSSSEPGQSSTGEGSSVDPGQSSFRENFSTEVPETEDPPILDGLVQEGNYYLFYINGVQLTKQGWQEISGARYYIGGNGHVTARMEEIGGNWRFYEYDVNTYGWAVQKDCWQYDLGVEYYFDLSGDCAKVYSTANRKLSIYQNGRMVLASNQTQTLSDGNLYYFGANGVRADSKGWKKTNAREWYLTDSKGSILAKMQSADGSWQYYDYNRQTVSWKKVANVWKVVEGREYYFSKNGRCTKIYTPSSGKCQEYRKRKMVTVKKDTVILRDGKIYYFNAKGKRITKPGWQKLSSEKYLQVGKKGYITCRLLKSKGIWRYYKYNYKSAKWVIQKNTWLSMDKKDYHFAKNGRCDMIYNIATKKCYKYTKGKSIAVKNATCVLKDGKIYHFNAKGICTSQAGWKEISAKEYAKVGKKGYVTHKMTNTSGSWKYYKRNYRTSKWEKQKKAWITVSRKEYYFDAKGNCTLIYNIKDKKCYDYKNGHMTLVRSDIRSIRSKKYYFGSDGKRVIQAGLYLTSAGKLVYVGPKGQVTKEIEGSVEDYEIADGRVIHCRVRNANSIYYYNSLGLITRKLDIYGKMVALTYDDGPSAYTSVILDVLDQNHSAATFFVLGQRVSAHASIIRRAYNMGCEIGNHTYSHQILTKVGISAAQNQISSTNTAVQNITGKSPVVMRPPGGAYNSTVAEAVGMPLILWSIDTLDWKTKNAASTQSAILNHVKDGDIILMHDLYNPTAEASKVVIPELVSRGYQLVTVSELADCRGGMQNGRVYHSFR